MLSVLSGTGKHAAVGIRFIVTGDTSMLNPLFIIGSKNPPHNVDQFLRITSTDWKCKSCDADQDNGFKKCASGHLEHHMEACEYARSIITRGTAAYLQRKARREADTWHETNSASQRRKRRAQTPEPSPDEDAGSDEEAGANEEMQY